MDDPGPEPGLGQEAFEAAYELAYRSSCQWLHILEHTSWSTPGSAASSGRRSRTEGVTDDQYKTPTAPWEDFAQLPYRFISAGPYPPPQGHDDTADWYLRLLIRTAGDTFAGTNADIVPFVNGRAVPGRSTTASRRRRRRGSRPSEPSTRPSWVTTTSRQETSPPT